tara:strand:+ start:600 stop:803 length:204 start_codon:yes stop_codon:yes gene_type:complete
MMNSKNAINEINSIVANSEVNDEVAEKLLAISSWLEAERPECDDSDDYEDDGQPDEAQEWYDYDPDC